MKEGISAVIITKNEEQNIGRCIDALLPIVDEVIVVDSHSTDKTAEICQTKGIRFFQIDWRGYGATKNFGNQQAKYTYILSVDADEAPDEELQKTILNLKREGLNGIYEVNRFTNYCGKWIKHSGWYPDWKLRLFPNAYYEWDDQVVHEALIAQKTFSSKKLQGHLLHYSYNDENDHRQRADKYSALTAQKLAQQGKKASLFKPYLSAVGRFITMFFIKLGFLDGKMGFNIAWISAQSNIFKYKELRRLNREQKSKLK